MSPPACKVQLTCCWRDTTSIEARAEGTPFGSRKLTNCNLCCWNTMYVTPMNKAAELHFTWIATCAVPASGSQRCRMHKDDTFNWAMHSCRQGNPLGPPDESAECCSPGVPARCPPAPLTVPAWLSRCPAAGLPSAAAAGKPQAMHQASGHAPGICSCRRQCSGLAPSTGAGQRAQDASAVGRDSKAAACTAARLENLALPQEHTAMLACPGRGCTGCCIGCMGMGCCICRSGLPAIMG